jgi:malic enzyme
MRKTTVLLGIATGAGLLLSDVVVRAEESSVVFAPLVSVREIMELTITPATNKLWSAWEEPASDAEWRQMEEAAITLLAASNLIALGGNGSMDMEWAQQPAWKTINATMIAAGQAALAASRNRDQQALLAAGDNLLPPCEGCHQLFNPGVVDAQ